MATMRTWRSDLLPSIALATAAACAAGVHREPDASAWLGAAARAADDTVRLALANVLLTRGDASAMPLLETLLTDANEQVRATAIAALASIGSQAPTAQTRVSRLLTERASAEPAGAPRLAALSALASTCHARGDCVAGLERAYAAATTPADRVFLALALANAEPADLAASAARCEALFTELQAQGVDFLSYQLLPHMAASARAAAAQSLCDNRNPRVAWAAQEQLSAAAAILAGTAPATSSARAAESESVAWNEVAWQEEDPRRLDTELASARLVLVGEVHDEGALRTQQIAWLRAFSTHPEDEAVGFETSVQAVQEPVLAVARELGTTLIALDPDLALGAQGRHRERDLIAAQRIDRWLDEDPRHRMFVLRGQNHVVTMATLNRAVHAEPVSILTTAPEVPLRVAGLDAAGRTFRLAVPGRRGVFWSWQCPDGVTARNQAVLREWLRAASPTSR